MKILVVGNGAREHALVWKLRQSANVETLFCAPGNPGIARLAECIGIAATDTPRLLEFALRKKIDLTVPGPEAPLVAGIVDQFEAQGLKIFGPNQAAARLEGSKAFAKYILHKYHVPTAGYEVFDVFEAAVDYISGIPYPCVIKADGLAAGKGAVIARTQAEAREALHQMMVENRFGEAGRKVVVEEFMPGEEASVFAITDGERLLVLPPSQDHKAIYDGDQGPNTGGMGAYAPAPVISPDLLDRIKSEILQPVIKGMALEGTPYRGVLYAGLMITEAGPKVVEFNCRFGDPETQVVLPLIKSDLAEIMRRAADRNLRDVTLEVDARWAVCVVMASSGYPGTYEKGKMILGVDEHVDGRTEIFQAGTTRGTKGELLTAGGRVLSVTAIDTNFRSAQRSAYEAVQKIVFDGAYYRKDIGWRALRRLKQEPRVM